MKLTVTFILVAFGSMLASAAEPAVISSATSVVSSSASAATSKVAVPTPPAPIQAAPTPADKTKITIPLPKSPVVPNHNIRPPHHNHWFSPGRKPFRPIPRPYGYPPFRPNPYYLGGLREKRSIPEASVRTQIPTYKQPPRLWNPALRIPPACGRIGGCGPNNLYDRMRSFNSGASVKTKRSPLTGMICLQLGGCGGGNWWRRPKRSILPTEPALRWPQRIPPTHILRLPFYRRPAQKRAPIVAPPFICAGLNCGGVRPLPFPRRPFTWPVFRKPARVNARSAEPEPEASAWCNPRTGSGCGGFGGFGGPAVGWRRQGGLRN